MDITILYHHFLNHPVVSTDSRQVPSGALFFALRGEQFDGNQFALQALENGAAFAVVDDPAVAKNDRCILVNDCLSTLQALATHHRDQFTIPVIAITGTNGKTTTKELMAAVLGKSYHICATVGNLNNHIGVPLTLLRINSRTDIAIIEMGANHPGEIAFLCSLAHPTHGIITNIGRAHLEGFGSLEGIIQTKTELYHYLRSQQGTIFINLADPLLVKHATQLKTVPYYLIPDPARYEKPRFLYHDGAPPPPDPPFDSDLSNSPKQDQPLLILPGFLPRDTTLGAIRKNDSSTLDIRYSSGSAQPIVSNLFGSYNAANLLAAACTGAYFNVPPASISEALSGYHPSNNRSQILRGKRNILIMDAYNANPSSMKEAIIDFALAPWQRKVFILGDMLELGEESPAAHQEIIDLLVAYRLYNGMLIGKHFKKTHRPVIMPCFQTIPTAIKNITIEAITDYYILIKGSRGMHLEQFIPVF